MIINLKDLVDVKVEKEVMTNEDGKFNYYYPKIVNYEEIVKVVEKTMRKNKGSDNIIIIVKKEVPVIALIKAEVDLLNCYGILAYFGKEEQNGEIELVRCVAD